MKRRTIKTIILLSVLIFLIVLNLSLLINYVYAGSENLIKNPGFEDIDGEVPTIWYTQVFDKTATDFILEESDVYKGNKSYSIINNKKNDAKIIQDITILEDGVYKISCIVKTENILQQSGSANITILQGNAIYTSKELMNTDSKWEIIEFQIKAKKGYGKVFKVILRLGGQGVLNKGKAIFDDVSVILMDEPDAKISLESFYIPPDSNNISKDTSDNNILVDDKINSPKSKNNLPIIGIMLIITTIVIIVEIKLSKIKTKNKNDDNEKEDIYEEKDVYENEEDVY